MLFSGADWIQLDLVRAKGRVVVNAATKFRVFKGTTNFLIVLITEKVSKRTLTRCHALKVG